MSENREPFKELGSRIKFLREQWQQSLNELSNTLEIDSKTLKSIEAGNLLPSDDQLEMLISHFLLTEDQAEDLLELADQGQSKTFQNNLPPADEMMVKQIMMMLMPNDNRTIYTDSMNAIVDDKGVVLQFMQKTPDSKTSNVARVGMSHEHAIEISRVIVRTLEQYFKAKKSAKKSPPKENK